MKTLKDAIELILSQPPEPHYPSYYADLLREADVPDKDVGKCSEIPNSSETIYRQAAIEALSVGKKALSRVLDEIDVVSTDREKFSWGLGLIESAIKDIEALPPAQPKVSMLTVTVAPDPKDIERAVRKIHDAPVTVLPSAQPERRKGKWIVDALANNIYRCSECGMDAPVEPTGGTEYKSNYCPNCGADMRGETDED